MPLYGWLDPIHRRCNGHDGTPLAYQVIGNPHGVPFLIFNGIGARYAYWQPFFERAGAQFRIICWDYRGQFESGRPVGGVGAQKVADHGKDALALLAHEGIEKCIALGWSMGAQVLLSAYSMNKNRFRAAILHNGLAGHPLMLRGSNWLKRLSLKPYLKRLQRDGGWLRKITLNLAQMPFSIDVAIRLGLLHHDIDRLIMKDLILQAEELDPNLIATQLIFLDEHDASRHLAQVHIPTMVTVGTHDPIISLPRARSLAHAVPSGQFEVLPGGSHYAAIEFPDLFYGQVLEFLEAKIAPENASL